MGTIEALESLRLGPLGHDSWIFFSWNSFLLSAVVSCSCHFVWPDSLSHNLWILHLLSHFSHLLHANTLIDFTLTCSWSRELSSSIADFKLFISVHSVEQFELSSVPKFSFIFTYDTRDFSLCPAIPLSDSSLWTKVAIPWDSHMRVRVT